MIKTYQYRIYPTIKQAKKLFAWLEILRNLYNQALAWRKTVYSTTGESVSWVTQADALPDLKQESAPFASLHSIGIDVGLESFLTTSDGDKIQNPRYFRTSEQKLGKSQRLLSRREKGSKRYNKQCEHVANVYEHIANQRRDFHYKTAHRLFLQCEEVAVEDLKICNMVQNHHLSKSISDAGWGNFRLILQSKAANAGKQLTKVNPKYTSQKCSGCEAIVKKSISVRVHCCNDCGLVLDRDHNAAINIKKAAVALRGGVVVTDTPETPRERKEAQNLVNPGETDNKPQPFRVG